jgi:hypothetical protein
VARAEREQPVRRNKPLPGYILYSYLDLCLHCTRQYLVNTLTGAIIGVQDQKIPQALSTSMPVQTQYRGQYAVDEDVLYSYILPLQPEDLLGETTASFGEMEQ